MSKFTPWALPAALSLIVGCGVQVAYTRQPGASAHPASAAPTAHCDDVRVLRGRAPREWKVVGVVDLAAFSVRALPRDDEAFLELVRPAVCAAGGDAVIAGVNGDGRYVLGTVIAWVEPGESAESPNGGAEPKDRDAEAPAHASTGDSPARRPEHPACVADASC